MKAEDPEDGFRAKGFQSPERQTFMKVDGSYKATINVQRFQSPERQTFMKGKHAKAQDMMDLSFNRLNGKLS